MRHEQAKPLVDKLMDIAVLYHASSLLRKKLYEAVCEYVPHLDQGCLERGCIAVDDFENCPLGAKRQESDDGNPSF